MTAALFCTVKMSFPVKKRVSNNCCSVVGCTNTRKSAPGLKFYSFPNKPWETDLKKRWIAAVRRETPDKKPWTPTKHSTICSAHFIGGVRSNDPNSHSYVPTIFPSIYKRKARKDIPRAVRLAERNEKKARTDAPSLASSASVDVADDLDSLQLDPPVETREIAVQTEAFDIAEENDMPNTLFCSFDTVNHEAATQTNICIPTVQIQNQQIVTRASFVETKDCSVGPDVFKREKFLGFEGVKDDSDMKHLSGITLTIFHILLRFIVPKNVGQPSYYRILSPEDRLLLFLMKMKLGLHFTALRIIFNISRESATTIFYSVLETLFESTKSWIFWPSKEAIKRTLPKSFVNYPNCRAIIDCTELKCDSPPTVEQRVLMYSAYKSSFTVKYLVAISPSGMITFVSKGYGGRSSDSYITNDSGFLNLIEPGDFVMADKGFPQIRTELLKKKCTLIMPPFGYNPQFTQEEILEGYSIASVRIHVERAIQRIKSFQVLQHINIKSLPYIDKIMYIACVLANNKEPLISEKEEQ